jgi:hypothetical protein
MKVKEQNRPTGNSHVSSLEKRRVRPRHAFKNQFVITLHEFYTSKLTCFNTSIPTSNYSYEYESTSENRFSLLGGIMCLRLILLNEK